MMISHRAPGERGLFFNVPIFVMQIAAHLKQCDSFRNVIAPSSHHCSGLENRHRKATRL
jgi:hypothetical protein